MIRSLRRRLRGRFHGRHLGRHVGRLIKMERNELIQLRVTTKEKADIAAKAGKMSLSVSEWLRKIASAAK